MAKRIALNNELPAHLSFLQRATNAITASADYQATLQHVAEAMVPTMSDWCALDIIENGHIKRVAIAHPDPAKIKIAQQLMSIRPVDPAADHGVAKVIRTGEPEMLNGVTDMMLMQGAENAEHLRLLRALNFHAFLIYPLIGYKNEIVGALTLVWTDHKQTYSLTDVAFAEILSSIAASAIQYARLKPAA